jgi:hypothetical protein
VGIYYKDDNIPTVSQPSITFFLILDLLHYDMMVYINSLKNNKPYSGLGTESRRFTFTSSQEDGVISRPLLLTCSFIAKFLNSLLRNTVLSIFLCALLALPIYASSPELFQWMLMKVGVSDVSSLELFRSISQKDSKILELNAELLNYQAKINSLEAQKSRALAEKDGILRIMNDYKAGNPTNFIIIGGVVTVVAVVAYWLFAPCGSNQAVIDLVIKSTDQLMKCNTEGQKVLSPSLDRVEKVLDSIQIALKNLNREIADLSKK